MTIGKIPEDNSGNFVISKGTKLTEVFDKLDVPGSLIRYVDYRESNGLPLPCDIYEKQKDGSCKIKK